VRITFVGHATVLIDTGSARILTDPLLDDWIGPLKRAAARPDPAAHADIDAVLLSHLHGDHVHLPSLRRVAKGGTAVIAPRGAGDWLREHEVEEITELRPGEDTEVAGTRVRATPAVHSGTRWPVVGPTADALGYLVETVYFAGDTDVFDRMTELAPRVDVALLPVWGWGPTLGPGHMDPKRAAEALKLLEPRIAIPIHWGTLHVPGLAGRDYMTTPPLQFAEHAAAIAPDVEVRVLQPGESATLS
jgi:L-ascorbate metabolism protein UlaG (beta-lactamase superfamily)